MVGLKAKDIRWKFTDWRSPEMIRMKRRRWPVIAHSALLLGTTAWHGSSIFAQTQLSKKQIPTATVYTDQANTFSSGDQDLSGATSLRVKTGTGAPLSSDCNSSGKVGRVY